jgi:hypothetical protein
MPDFDWGAIFGSTGLRVRSRVFAVANDAGDLMVKISERRAGELISEGAVTGMIMHGREMREWVTMPIEAGADNWRELVGEAHAYLDQITPRGLPPVPTRCRTSTIVSPLHSLSAALPRCA